MAGSPSEFVLQAQELIARRQYQEAVKVCRLGLLQHPGVVEARVLLGQALMALGRHDEVLGEMRVAIEANPASATAYLLKGEALYLKGDYEDAEDALKEARQLEPEQPRVKLLLSEIAAARRDGLFPDRTSEGPGTKEYPAFRQFREMAEQAPGGAVDGVVPQPAVTLSSDFEEPDSTVVDDMPPEFFNAAPVVSLVPPGGRAVPPPSQPAGTPPPPGSGAPVKRKWPEPSEELNTRPWAPDHLEQPTSPAETAAPTELLSLPERMAAARPSPFDQGTRPISVSGQIDAETRMPMTETGSIQLGEGDLVADDEDEDDGIEPEEIEPDEEEPGPTVNERPAAPAPPAWLRSPPATTPPPPTPPPASVLPVLERWQPAALPPTYIPSGQITPAYATPAAAPPAGAEYPPSDAWARPAPADRSDEQPTAGWVGPRGAQSAEPPPEPPTRPAQPQPAMAPLQIIAAADPRESPIWGAARVAPPPQEEPEDDLHEPTVPAKRRASRNPSPRLAPAPSRAPAHEAPAWSSRQAQRPAGASPSAGGRRGVAPVPPWQDEEEEEDDTTTARPSPVVTAPSASWRELIESHLGEGRTRVRRLAALGSAALLFLVAIGLVIGALRARHHAQSQLTVAWRQVATGNYPGHQIALRAFEQAAADRPRDVRALAARAFTAAALALEFGEPVAQAKAAVAAAAARAGSHPDVVAADGYLALIGGDFAGAALRARALTEQQPRDPRGPYLEARVRLEEGAHATMVPLLAEALNRDPRHIASLHALGLAHAAMRRPAEARAAWQRALSENPIHVASLLDQALFAVQRREDLANAETTLVSIISGKLKGYASPAQIAWANLTLGRLYLERGDGSRAAPALARAASLRPERAPQFAEQLCGTYLRAGDSARARAELTRFATLPSAKVALRKGGLLVLEGQPTLALDELQKAPAGDPETLLWRGRAYVQLRRYGEASRELNSALVVAPRLVGARIELARIDLAQNRINEANAALAKLNDDDPGNAQVLEALGEALLARGDRNVAKRSFTDAVTRSPGLAGARLQLARLLRREGRWEEARLHLEGALAARPELLEARTELAQLLYDLGDGPAARREWEAILKRRHDAATAIAAARATTLARDPEAAMRHVDEAQRLGRGRALPLREGGRALLVQRAPAKALEKLRRAVDLDPSDLEAQVLYFDALLDAGDVETARKELPKVSKRFPRAAEMGMIRGRLELESGQGAAAASALETACTRLKANAAPPRTLAECLTLHGRSYHYQASLKRATELFSQARKLDPHNAQAQYFGGVVFAELEQHAEAVQAFEKAVAADPRFAEAWFRLAEARLKGKSRGAAGAYREYLKLAPSGEFAAEAREKLQTLENATLESLPSRPHR
jgi:tetratricopeptide (TPR) repeat protein